MVPRTEVIITLTAVPGGTRLLVETAFAHAAEHVAREAYKENSEGWDTELADLVAYLDGRLSRAAAGTAGAEGGVDGGGSA
ncbi:MAG: hypothetical protein FWJ70_02325 [Micromonosporaceae bacterium]|jgi:hypothetical protein